MKTTPTAEQLENLPKWAQKHIKDLTRQAFMARRELREYVDNQTESNFYTENWNSDEEKLLRNFIQTHKMTILRDDVEVTVLLRHDEPGIDISWTDHQRISREVALIPIGFNSIRILKQGDMR